MFFEVGGVVLLPPPTFEKGKGHCLLVCCYQVVSLE
ncbi:MAG: hypothetical protein ACI845_002859 [Gammaproteobacteria bacterium]|jgi:hypothetical protein